MVEGGHHLRKSHQLAAPNHYPNQNWLTCHHEAHQHLVSANFTKHFLDVTHCTVFGNYIYIYLKIRLHPTEPNWLNWWAYWVWHITLFVPVLIVHLGRLGVQRNPRFDHYCFTHTHEYVYLWIPEGYKIKILFFQFNAFMYQTSYTIIVTHSLYFTLNSHEFYGVANHAQLVHSFTNSRKFTS